MPTTTAYGGTSLFTTAPAATTAPSPILPTPGMMIELWPSQTSLPMLSGLLGRLPSTNPSFELKKKACIDLWSIGWFSVAANAVTAIEV